MAAMPVFAIANPGHRFILTICSNPAMLEEEVSAFQESKSPDRGYITHFLILKDATSKDSQEKTVEAIKSWLADPTVSFTENNAKRFLWEFIRMAAKSSH